MILFIVLLAISAREVVKLSPTVMETSRDIARNFLPQLCPGITPCGDNQTLGKDSSPNQCCTECSCDKSCGFSKNCCFPKDPSSLLDSSVTRSKCLYPMTKQVTGSLRRIYQTYWIVDEVKTYNSNFQTSKCGEEITDPWGSLIPISSKSTGKIYKNSACAEADNVTDGVVWDFLITCKLFVSTIHINDIPKYISNLYNTEFPKYCHLHFRYPGNILNMKSNECFTNLINTCKSKAFRIPNGFNLTKSQIRHACTSGLVSPYRAGDMYANVFCYICNGNQYSEKERCFMDADGNGKFSGSSIIVQVDGIFLSESYRKQNAMKEKLQLCPETYVIDRMQGSCRQIYCSSGQLRDENNKCMYWVKKLFMDRLVLNIKLTAETAFDVRETFDSNTLSLSHKWPQVWIIKSVSKRVLTTYMHTILFVKLIHMFPKADTRKLLKRIGKLFELPWKLTLSNGTSISMSADLGIDASLFSNINSINSPSQEWIERIQLEFPQFSFLYNQKQIKLDIYALVITKLYFCEQVELQPTEYEMLDKTVLYNKITKQTLFNGEFAIITAPHFNGVRGMERVRICVEDSGFLNSEIKIVAVKSNSIKAVALIPLLATFVFSLVR